MGAETRRNRRAQPSRQQRNACDNTRPTRHPRTQRSQPRAAPVRVGDTSIPVNTAGLGCSRIECRFLKKIKAHHVKRRSIVHNKSKSRSKSKSKRTPLHKQTHNTTPHPERGVESKPSTIVPSSLTLHHVKSRSPLQARMTTLTPPP